MLISYNDGWCKGLRIIMKTNLTFTQVNWYLNKHLKLNFYRRLLSDEINICRNITRRVSLTKAEGAIDETDIWTPSKTNWRQWRSLVQAGEILTCTCSSARLSRCRDPNIHMLECWLVHVSNSSHTHAPVIFSSRCRKAHSGVRQMKIYKCRCVTLS